MRRLLVAGAALLAAAGVSAALLFATSREPSQTVYALARDLPAGAAVSDDALTTVRVNVGEAASSLVGPGDARLRHAVTTHELAAGQLLARGDLAALGSGGGDRRFVFVPLKDAPPIAPGDHVDLLSITGPGDRPTVAPLAIGLEVRAVAGGGIVVAVPSRVASALVYAAASTRLVAVVGDPGARPGQEPVVGSLEQANEVLRG